MTANLTSDPATQGWDRHAADTYFLEAQDDLTELGIDPRAFGHQHAIALLKPDAAVAGNLRVTLDWLQTTPLDIVCAYAVPLTPLTVRALWYSQWAKASAARRRLADSLISFAPALVVILRNRVPSGVPAAVTLTALKGPADPALREPGQLRSVLGDGTFLLNQVHTPDDPADLVRELGIYFDGSRRRDVLAEIHAGTTPVAAAYTLADEIMAATPQRSVRFDDATAQLRQAYPQLASVESVDQWRAALGALDACGERIDPWTRLVLESAVLPMSVPAPDHM